MQKVPSQTGFSLIELLTILAIIGVLAAFAAPRVTSYVRHEEARRAAGHVASSIQAGRNAAMSRGRMTFVMFDASSDGDGGDAGAALGFAADQGQIGWLVVDENKNHKADAPPNDTVKPVFAAVGSNTVKLYRADEEPPPPYSGAALPDDDLSTTDPAAGLGYLGDSNTLPQASNFAQPSVAFTSQGVPVMVNPDDSLGAWGSGAGGMYLTDGVDSVFGVLVMPLGDVKVVKYNAGTDQWN